MSELESLLKQRRSIQSCIESVRSCIKSQREIYQSDEQLRDLDPERWAEIQKLHRDRIGVTRRIMAAYRRMLARHVEELADIDRRLAEIGVNPPAPNTDPPS
jgi:hypothetical protein